MKSEQTLTWIDERDITNDSVLKSDQNAEFNPIALESFLEDERSGHLQGNRRDFLKVLGFGIGAATLASCEIPVKKAIPYVIKPDEIVPGIANYYASSFVHGGDYCSILVKTREGRPIKIEGNALSSITKGGTSARTQSAVLSLYDYNRVKEPAKVLDGKLETITWLELDNAVKSSLQSGNVRVLSSTIMSPSTKKAIQEFSTKYPKAKHISYDAVSSAALLDATQKCFGERVLPDYRFDKAQTIVSFNADFLGTWISPIEYATQYVKHRSIDPANPSMSKHVQIESHMSLTGSNADNRILVKPSEQGTAIAVLYNEIAGKTGGPTITASGLNEKARAALVKLADILISQKGKSLVVSGSNNIGEQVLVHGINSMLGNLGETVNFARASFQRQGNDLELNQLLTDMNSGAVDALILWDANPCFDLPMANAFKDALAKVKTKISLNSLLDETSLQCTYMAPQHHMLESWGDVEPKRGLYSFIQPTINPIFNTRQGAHSLLVWAESSLLKTDAEQPFYEFLKDSWISQIGSNWDKVLHDGVYEIPSSAVNAPGFKGNATEAAGMITKISTAPLEISFIENISIGSGQYANNPWLQELPDPVTRCAWGNYVMVPISFDGDNRFISFNDIEENGELVDVAIAGNKITVGAVKQFGQMQGTVAIAVGYGRSAAGVCGSGIGTDVYPSLTMDNGYIQYFNTNVEVSKSLGSIEKNFACVQHHHTLGVTAIEKSSGKKINADEAALVDETFKGITKGYQGSLTKRSIIRQSNLKDLGENIALLETERKSHQKLNSHTLYPGYDYKYNSGHHWGMHIDLNACIGCGACAVACMAENNVPVVGKREVSRHHEMSWLRIDRYFYGDVDNPNVVYQPMMCQHCNNAPCENVCPVNATNHSQEGLNQMIYNRCVGTRYCANNCPYKVRRFNWYDFTAADLFPVNQHNIHQETDKPYYADNLIRMVLNPDVTVRSRGVIEKCSFCVQRIQDGKLTAKREGRGLLDNDVKTACQTSCPTGAITFGDMNNSEGQLSKKNESPLNYIVLEEINVKSVVNYTMKVNNRDENLDA
ncbi:MAG: 4Fe-4S dicluster domain-containing protein [Bacteroidota bacterium]|nr:4Fe-4S dicluster domain-containing protein [Bacteroidota bacterium]